MRLGMPLLALLVAILLVASQSLYTVDQRKYAVKLQLGKFVDTKAEPGLYFKVPLLENVKFYDRVNLTLDNPEPDRMTTSEKRRSTSHSASRSSASSPSAAAVTR